MSAVVKFVPFHESDHTSESVVGYRADASYLELTNEADLRSHAAQKLLSVLSCLEGFDEFTAAEVAGCFLAVHLLTADVGSLQRGAYESWRKDRRRGGSQ